MGEASVDCRITAIWRAPWIATEHAQASRRFFVELSLFDDHHAAEAAASLNDEKEVVDGCNRTGLETLEAEFPFMEAKDSFIGQIDSPPGCRMGRLRRGGLHICLAPPFIDKLEETVALLPRGPTNYE